MTEDQLEQEALGWLADVGYRHRYGPELAPEGSTPERADYRQVLLVERLRRAIAALNPSVPLAAVGRSTVAPCASTCLPFDSISSCCRKDGTSTTSTWR